VRTDSRIFSSYHVFDNGHEFRPVLPKTRVSPGDAVRITLERLPLPSFVSSMPHFALANRELMKWMSDKILVESPRLEGRMLRIRITQEGSPAGVRQFELMPVLDAYPGRCNQHGGVYLQCHLTDYIGRNFLMRICYNGVDLPQFQIDRGAGFETVTMISYDGFRLSFRYGVRGTTSTLYMKGPPDSRYKLEPPRRYSGSYLGLVKGMYTRAWVGSVRVTGRVERAMFQYGSSYDQGRIGSEIAYAYARRFLGLKELVIEEPSKHGRDLYTLDQLEAIQARMIRSVELSRLGEAIQTELLSLARKIGRDYSYNPEMQTGYAVLSFPIIGNSIGTLLMQVAHPREWRFDGKRLK